MHGLVNRSIQCFVRDTYGPDHWQIAARRAGWENGPFDPLQVYDDALTLALVDAVAAVLNKPREAMLEDLGTYLVSQSAAHPVRRLLRFCGTGFVPFLLALEDLPDRVRLAFPDLDLPRIRVGRDSAEAFRITMPDAPPGMIRVLTGVLRAMADDYGALVLLDCRPDGDGGEEVSVRVMAADFAEARAFALVGAGGAHG